MVMVTPVTTFVLLLVKEKVEVFQFKMNKNFIDLINLKTDCVPNASCRRSDSNATVGSSFVL